MERAGRSKRRRPRSPSRATGEHRHEADRRRAGAVSSAARVSAVKAAMSPNGTKITRVTAKISTRPSADQDIDGPAGDAVHRQDRRDLAFMRARSIAAEGTSSGLVLPLAVDELDHRRSARSSTP